MRFSGRYRRRSAPLHEIKLTARSDFEAEWQDYLSRCTETDFVEYRRQRAFTSWKYAMHDVGLPLPTQSVTGRARCFCGAALDLATMDQHVHEVHLTERQDA